MKNKETHTMTRAPIDQQQGFALFIALVFLFLSTLIGITTLRTSLLNEKMTSNTIQREQALEAAEAALLEGEAFVEENTDAIITAVISNPTSNTRTVTDAAKTCTAFNGGICAPKEFFSPTNFENWVDIEGDVKSLKVWSTSGRHRTMVDNISTEYNLSTAPKFIIEFMGYVRTSGNSGDTACINPSEAWQLLSWPYCVLDPAQFRITALATTGNLDQTRVMLQTTYVVN